MPRYVLAVALLLVVVPLAVVVSDEIPNDRPAFCLLLNGVSWRPVDSLPEALRQHVTEETATQVMNGVTFVPIKRFVEAQGGSVGWDSAAGAVTVEFEGQNIAFKALHSENFWASPSVRTLTATLLSVSTDSKSEPSTESGTNPSEQWEPPRLVDGVWVTSGVSDEEAKEYAAQHNADKTEAEIRDQEWDVYWRWHWDEGGAPEWAMRRGEEGKAAQRAAEKMQWQQYYSSQSQWGLPGNYYPGQLRPITAAEEWLLGIRTGIPLAGTQPITRLGVPRETDRSWILESPQSKYWHQGRPLSLGYSPGGSSPQCGATTKTTGAPCRNRVKGGGYCHLHR